MASQHSFQAPTGTRDLYPLDAAKRRFITESWRATSLRHGFEEVDGPTFEHLELYTVKSGEGIISELFSFQRAGGEKTYALRPEFTPTLARLFAAKAGSLAKPSRWFTAGPFFRAERPQRGRLREFLQWNADIIGDPSPTADAEVIACCVGLLESLGLTPRHCRVSISHRGLMKDLALHCGLPDDKLDAWFAYLDGEAKRSKADNDAFLVHRGVPLFVREKFDAILEKAKSVTDPTNFTPESLGLKSETLEQHRAVLLELRALGLLDWCQPPIDLRVVRGLAYYTGMVFEIHEISGGERALAGGGRYDNLIELFGGPATPAVGFGMGDVVLSLVLQDNNLLPADDIVLERAGLRPDVFVISNGTPQADAALQPMLAFLRRAGLHARRTGKTTKNIGKLLQDASGQRARVSLILESDQLGQLKDMASGTQLPVPLATILPALATLGVLPR